MKSTLDRIHDGVSNLTQASYDLAAVARALHRVGLTALADEIAEIGVEVSNNAKAVRDAHAEEIVRRARDSDEATKTVVRAVLAGCELSSRG